MLSRLPKLFLILALSCSIGLHWTFLQSVAWTSMLVAYSRDSGFVEAMERTFDGQHPCTLCKIVREGKKTEKSQTVLRPVLKLEFWNPNSTGFIHPPSQAPPIRRVVDSLRPRPDPPLLPPPRLSAVTL